MRRARSGRHRGRLAGFAAVAPDSAAAPRPRSRDRPGEFVASGPPITPVVAVRGNRAFRRFQLRWGAGDGVHGDDGCGLGGLPLRQRRRAGRRPPGPGSRVLRLPGRDAAAVGRQRRCRARPGGNGDPLPVHVPLRPGRGQGPSDRRPAGFGEAPRHGAGHRRLQERGRAGGDRSGRAHARHPGRRTRRHPGLPRQTDPPVRGDAGAARPPRRRHRDSSTPTPATPPPGPGTPTPTTTCSSPTS